MKQILHVSLALLVSAWFLCLVFLVAGCAIVDSSSGEPEYLFPNPIGDRLIPLRVLPVYTFHYTQLDETGGKMPPFPDLTLTIRHRGATAEGDTIYEWDYESNNRGDLLIFRETPVDSSGIYTVGTFNGPEETHSEATLLFPQFPERVGNWTTSYGSTMKCLAHDTSYMTTALFSGSMVSQGHEAEFQAHLSYLIQETRGDTAAYYYFRKGIGLLGFERVIDTKTVVVGTLFKVVRRDQRTEPHLH